MCTAPSKKGLTVSCDIFQRVLDVTVNSIYIFCEAVYIPCSDFDPGVIHIPEQVARSSSCEACQGSAFNFFHVEVGHCWGHQLALGTAMLLSVETFTVPEVGGYQTEVK